MIWCLGMYGSASTWTFNVVQKIAGSLAPTKPVIPVFAADGPPPHDDAAGTLVVKTHGGGTGRELDRRAQAIIITVRDPRDAVASLMLHNKAPFDLAIRVTEVSAWACARFMTRRRALLLKFEDRFFDDPATVQRIAARLPGALPEVDSLRIFEELRRGPVDAFIANLETVATTQRGVDPLTGQWDTYDPATGWHKHHAGRDAEIGRWRRALSDVQARAVQARMQRWMERFGYLPAASIREPHIVSVGPYGITR